MRKKLESKVRELHKNKSTWKEGENLEFKNGGKGLPGSLWETYSAFANTVRKAYATGSFMAPRDDFMVPKDDFMAPKPSNNATIPAHKRVIQELGIPAPLEKQIEEYRRKNRQAPEGTMSLILDICHTRWVTTLQLSILLNREVRPLRKNFLQPAILCRKLEHLYPESPKNKNQAYRTVE